MPAHGYAASSHRDATTLQLEGAVSEGDAVRHTRRTNMLAGVGGGAGSNKPQELQKIERFIEVEWKRRNCR